MSKQQAPGGAYFSWTQCCHIIAIQDVCVQDWFKLNWIETVLEKDYLTESLKSKAEELGLI